MQFNVGGILKINRKFNNATIGITILTWMA